MNETNGLGAVVPVGLREEIERIARLLGPTNDLPVRMKVSGAYDALMELTVAMDNAAPSPQPVPGSDAELRINEYFACIESRESDPLVPAAPPQESDKGREQVGMDRERIASLRIFEKALRSDGKVVGSVLQECLDALESTQARIATLERQLSEARAEVEALREEVALTNEHEHQILQERNELAEALLQSMGSEGGIPMTDRLNDALSACGVDYERELPPPDAAPTQAAPELADLLRKQYPRLLERGNPLYDGVLAAAVERAGAADVVTVPREEWEEYQTAKTGFRFAKGWTMICTEDLDALRSSAQGGKDGG